MSKLSFRARALDAGKPMPIYMAEELPDLPDYSAINRAVPQMPSGMQKEEECEHHLQRAICAGLIIPTPDVNDIPNKEFYDKVYPANYKQPRQLIHMQPFTMEQDIPDYDMDSDDEKWLQSQTQRLELSPLKFEEMMDRLEKSSGQTVVTLNEAKALLKEDDDLIIAVFDYWLNKRLKTQHPLILTVKTEHRVGTAANNPYLAFRRRTEKMQTRKNRKNDEASYEKMLKLRRDLYRAVTLLELVKRREKIKREYVHLTVEVFEKRYQAKDFSGNIMAEASAVKLSRSAFTPIFHNHYTNQSWTNKTILKDEIIPRREKRPYKKRKHKSLTHNQASNYGTDNLDSVPGLSSDEDATRGQLSPEPEETEDEGQFAFRRNRLCSYHMPLPQNGTSPSWRSQEENCFGDKRFRFSLTSLSNPKRCIGFARRRVGRGGRIILDRISTNYDDFWRTLDFSITEPSLAEDKELNLDTIINKANLSERQTSLNHIRTDIKKEFSHSSNNLIRTGISEFDSCSVKVEVKKEPEDTSGETNSLGASVHTSEERAEMLEFLQSVRKEWLHFRPKTPPPSEDSSCHLLPADENIFSPSDGIPFSMEIQPLETPTSLLDTSTFVTDTFAFDNLDLPIPITDTRQTSDKNVQKGINLNVNAGLNTLNSSVDNSFCNVNLNDSITLSETNDIEDISDYRTIGCSRFTVSDSVSSSLASKIHIISSSTLTSPKLNSVNTVSDGQLRTTENCVNTNGLLSQLGLDGWSHVNRGDHSGMIKIAGNQRNNHKETRDRWSNALLPNCVISSS